MYPARGLNNFISSASILHLCEAVRVQFSDPLKYVIFIAFPQQKWLRERASILRHQHIAYLFPAVQQSNTGKGTLLLRFLVHTRLDARARANTHTHTSTHLRTPSAPVISPSHRPLPTRHTQQTQETYIHSFRAIRTRDPSKWATAEPRLRPHSRRVLLQTLFLVPSNHISVPSCEGVSMPTGAVRWGGRAPVRI